MGKAQATSRVIRPRPRGCRLIDIAERDIDVPLSPLGEQQSIALGQWFGAPAAGCSSRMSCCAHPTCAPAQTARLVLEAAGIAADSHILHADERLREKEFGILDRLTTFGIRERHPELSEQRAHVGKFYFRPPGGESWCDVILRLRSVIDTMTREYRGERVLIVAHQVIVNCFRYLLERMNEAQILDARSRRRRSQLRRDALRVRSSAGQERQARHSIDQFCRSARRGGHTDHDRGRRAGGAEAMRDAGSVDADSVEVDDECLRRWPLPQPDADGDKEERGRVLIIAGSREMPGAVILAANAALQRGSRQANSGDRRKRRKAGRHGNSRSAGDRAA